MSNAVPLVTVLTPSIPERAGMLEECRASVAAQTVPVMHIVELDDAYTGTSATMNRLWPQATTPWVAGLSDDDLLEPDFTEKLLAEAEKTPGMDVYYCWCFCLGRGEYDPNKFNDGNFSGVPVNGLFSRELVERVGGWRPIPLGAEGTDIDFLRRCQETGARFHLLEERLWSWRFHGANLCMGELPQGKM